MEAHEIIFTVITKALAEIPLQCPVKGRPSILEYVAMGYYSFHRFANTFVVEIKALMGR
jgi:hypothetical protein